MVHEVYKKDGISPNDRHQICAIYVLHQGIEAGDYGCQCRLARENGSYWIWYNLFLTRLTP